MDATGVNHTSVVGFEKICKNAELSSTITLAGHINAAAYLAALSNSISEGTGVDILHWNIGGQFELSARGADRLPAGFLPASLQHISETHADTYFGVASHRETYSEFSKAREFLHSGRHFS